jgi:putative LysE/RhtB family amino acid efflux pump
MFLFPFLKALLLGVVVAAPVGPVGALVIRRTLRVGPGLGIATGVGAAIADAVFALIAALGLGAAQSFFLRHELTLAVGGGLLILVIGFVSLFKNLRERREELEATEEANEETFLRERPGPLKILRAIGASFLITITNPMTIVGFGVAFTALGLVQSPGHESFPIVLVAGVLAGSMCWWATLSMGVRWMERRMSKMWIFKVHVLTSLMIIVSGLACLARGLMSLPALAR